jgi:accessory colonization factor AcfC
MNKEITIAYVNYWQDPKNDKFFSKFIESNIGPCKLVLPNDNPDILVASVSGNIDNITKDKKFYLSKDNKSSVYMQKGELYISEPTEIKRFQDVKEEKVEVGDHDLSFVKKSDLIDFNSLMKEISD